MRTTHDKLEDYGRVLVRRVQHAWLRAKFATGGWRGVMIHADRRGRVTSNLLTEGLYVTETSPQLDVVLNGKTVFAVNVAAPEEDR